MTRLWLLIAGRCILQSLWRPARMALFCGCPPRGIGGASSRSRVTAEQGRGVSFPLCRRGVFLALLALPVAAAIWPAQAQVFKTLKAEARPCQRQESAKPELAGLAPAFSSALTPFSHLDRPEHVSIDPQGRWMLSSTRDVVWLWDLKTGLLDRALKPQFRHLANAQEVFPANCVIQAGFSADGGIIFAADSTGIFRWRRESLEKPAWTNVPATLRHGSSYRPLMNFGATFWEYVEVDRVRYAVAPDQRLIAVSGPVKGETNERVLQLLDGAGRKVHSATLPFTPSALAFTRTGEHVLVAGVEIGLRGYSVVVSWLPLRPVGLGVLTGSLRPTRTVRIPGRDAPRAIVPGSTDDRLVLLFAGKLLVVSGDAASPPQEINASSIAGEPLADWLAVDQQARFVVTDEQADRRWGVGQWGLVLLDPSGGRRTGPTTPLAGGAEYVLPTPDGKQLVAWPSEPTRDAVLIDSANGFFGSQVPGSGGAKVRAAFNAAGDRLFVVRHDQRNSREGQLLAYAVDGSAFRLLRKASVSSDQDTEIAVSPDSRWLVLITNRKPYLGAELNRGGHVEVRDAEELGVVTTPAPPADASWYLLRGPTFACGMPAVVWYAQAWAGRSGEHALDRAELVRVDLSTGRREGFELAVANPGASKQRQEPNFVDSLAGWMLDDYLSVHSFFIRERWWLMAYDHRANRFVRQLGAPPYEGLLLDMFRSPCGRVVAFNSGNAQRSRATALLMSPQRDGARSVRLDSPGCGAIRALAFSEAPPIAYAACASGAVIGWRLPQQQ